MNLYVSLLVFFRIIPHGQPVYTTTGTTVIILTLLQRFIRRIQKPTISWVFINALVKGKDKKTPQLEVLVGLFKLIKLP